MIKTPLILRLAKLKNWQLKLFMLCLCERMYPNFEFYCKLHKKEGNKVFKSILNLNWESLLIKNAKIDFDLQLEKLEAIIPELDDQSAYSIYPAIDACEALAELLHSYISGEEQTNHAIAISKISLKTIIDLDNAKTGKILDEIALKEHQDVMNELDIQWDIYRVIKNQQDLDIKFIKDLKTELREEQISNIGIKI